MTPLGTAEIIAVGSELLTPYRSDTNSLYLTERLNDLGIEVRGKSVVGDDRGELAVRLEHALARADLVITTGGLGPTEDDVTRDAVASMLGRRLSEDGRVLEAITQRFARRGMRMADNNRRQALVPEGAVVLDNPRGTAPGLWLDAGERVLVLLPGPPRELQPLFASQVAPRLAARTTGRRLHRRVVRMTGLSESRADEIAHPIYAVLAQRAIPIQTTILSAPGQIELHLSASGESPAVDPELDEAVRTLAAALGDVVFSVDGRTLAEVVGAALARAGFCLAIAESCTAGLVMARVTDVPGSSAWFVGGVVAYDNAVKVREVGVPQELLDRHGAVSEPVAQAMAAGIRARLAAEVGLGVTGIAGPSGGSDAKPVGTVVIALSSAAADVVKTFRFAGDRGLVRRHATQAALDMIRRALPR